MALLGAAALMFFGPEQLPKVARKVGLLVRDVQNTSQSFIREMERAADDTGYNPDISRAHLLEEPLASGGTAPVYEPPLYEPYPAHEPYVAEPYVGEHETETAAHPSVEHEMAAEAVPVSPLHDVMPPRAARPASDTDLPP